MRLDDPVASSKRGSSDGDDDSGDYNEGGAGWGQWIFGKGGVGGDGDRGALASIPEEDGDFAGEHPLHNHHLAGAPPCTTAYTRPSIMSRVYMVMDEYRLTLQLLFLVLGTVILWQCANHCVPCIFVLMIVSCFFCLEYRLVNLLLWACIVVLWMHGWTFSSSSGNGLHASMGWDRRRR